MNPTTPRVSILATVLLVAGGVPSPSALAILPAHALSVPASAFVPGSENARYQRDFAVLVNRGEAMPYAAAIYLPPRARIIGLEFDGIDSSPDAGMQLKLVAIQGDSQWAVLAELDTTPAWRGGRQTWSTDVGNHAVLERWGYELYLAMPQVPGRDASVVQFAGARVIYAFEGTDNPTRER